MQDDDTCRLYANAEELVKWSRHYAMVRAWLP